VLTPTGCPARIPALGANPFPPGERVILFLGSLAANHMAEMINQAARKLAGRARIHLVGLNKTQLYGPRAELDPLIIVHRERPEEEVWDFIRWADLGLALATGRLAFDNDVSKIYNYLRGGLPVLSEAPILQNKLIRETGLGAVFKFGDGDDLVAQALKLLAHPPAGRERVMAFMAQSHSWETRVETYVRLMKDILGPAFHDSKGR
ncbi:MAG: hypothetical protein JRJ59_04830, partial [Deltaproteobacteria bacterium]|nr:hypothetical protein [Deltaproteobacteria bacterium]